MAAIWNLPWLEKVQRVSEMYWRLKTQFYYSLFWGTMGAGSKIVRPMRLRNVHNIHVGRRVIINSHAFLLTLPAFPPTVPRLSIGDGSVLGHMNHITCVKEVSIGKNVLTADRVFISDHSHGFENPNLPIMQQAVTSNGPVKIGDGAWIGENACVIGCSVGNNSVVGANSVVIHDVPPYSVAVGIPARVVRQYNPQTAKWERVERA